MARNKKNTTLKDIAENTGFSIATISHVINNTRYVDHETRQKVLESIKKLGYKITKTSQARTKSSNRPKSIGLIIGDIREDFFSDLIKHTETMLRNYGYHVIFCDSEQNSKYELEYIDFLLKNNVEGLILTPNDVSQTYSFLLEQNIPTVLVDRNIDSRAFDFIGIDNFQAGREAAKKLIELNLKNIAFITYPETNFNMRERKAGYVAAMQEAGLYKKENILHIDFHNKPAKKKTIYDFLKGNPKLEGVVCPATMICNELLGCINELNIPAAQNIKVVAFDDNKWYNNLSQKVSTIKSPTVDFASIIAELIINKIKNPFAQTIPKKIILDYQYINRF